MEDESPGLISPGLLTAPGACDVGPDRVIGPHSRETGLAAEVMAGGAAFVDEAGGALEGAFPHLLGSLSRDLSVGGGLIDAGVHLREERIYH
jgi:hypothetical protein